MLRKEQKVVSSIWENGSLTQCKLDLRDCDPVVLSDELLNTATLTSIFEQKFIDYMFILAQNQQISYVNCLQSFCKYSTFSKHLTTIELCKNLAEFFPIIGTESFIHSESVRSLAEAINSTFSWLLQCIKTILDEEEYENEESFLLALSTTISLLKNELCGKIVGISNKPDVKLKEVLEIEEIIKESDSTSELAKELAEQLTINYKRLFNIPQYIHQDCVKSLYNVKSSTFRILTAVFSCFRVLLSIEEVADFYQIFSEIMEVPFEDVVFDIIHSTLLIKAEETVDLPFLPKHLQINFRWHTATFFYKKLPKMLSIMIKKYKKSADDIAKAIKRVLDELVMTLDIVDLIWKDSSVNSLLAELVESKVIEKVVADSLIEQRYRQMHNNTELDKLTKIECSKQDSDFGILKLADSMLDEIKIDEKITFDNLITLIHSNSTFDAFCANLCADGKILMFSQTLVRLNKSSEEPKNSVERLKSFDLSFLLLIRISIKFPSIPLKLLVGSTIDSEKQGIYFKWCSRFLKMVRKREKPPAIDKDSTDIGSESLEKNIDEKIEIDKTENEEKQELKDEENNEAPELLKMKEDALVHLASLKEKQTFWDDDDDDKVDIVHLIESIPAIGEILLEEFSCKQRIDRNNSNENIANIVSALDELSCLLVCLIQWLDCQTDSLARRTLSVHFLNAIEKKAMISKKFAFILTTMRQTLVEICEKPPVYPEVTCTAFSTCRRFCPTVERDESPDMHKLKSAWYYMQLQGWASPHALRLLEHSNWAGDYNVWSHVYVNKSIKMGCGEMIKKGMDMICAFSMLDNFNCLIRMHESLVEFWFNEEAETSCDGRFEPSSVMMVIRLMTNIMLLSVWTLEKYKSQNDNGPSAKKPAFGEQIEAPDVDDPDSAAKWVHLLNGMINVTINRFVKIMRKGLLSPVVCAICQLMKSIAGAPECEAKRLLIRRIPPKLLFDISYIDPSAITFELFCVFCDPNNEEHTLEKIRFLCALRRRNII